MKTLKTLETTETTTVQQALQIANNSLSHFASSTDFNAKMQLAFGNHKIWEKTDLIDFPTIEIRPAAEINNARGAFATATNTIYLSQELVNENSGNVGAIASVLVEEYGHYLDAQNNAIDSPGDEGELFASLVLGKALSESELLALWAEDDSAIVFLGGRITIEQAETKIENEALQFSADNVSLGQNLSFPDEFRYEDFSIRPEISGLPLIDLGAGEYELRLDSDIKSLFGIVPFLKLRQLGEANFQYPISLDLELPKQLSSQETASIKTEQFNVEESSIEGSGFSLEKAGIDFEFGIGPINVNFSGKYEPLGLNIQNESLANINGFEDKITLYEILIPPPELGGGVTVQAEAPLGDFVTLSLTPPEVTEFTQTEPPITPSLLPTIEATGKTKDFVSLSADIDKYIGYLALTQIPQLLPLTLGLELAKQQVTRRTPLSIDFNGLGFELKYPKNPGSRNLFQFSGDLLDVTANLNFGLEQKLTATPQVQVTMSVDQGSIDGSSESTKSLGQMFNIAPPAEGTGVMTVEAKYELTGDIKSDIDLILDGQGAIKAEALKFNLAGKLGPFSINRKFAPKPLLEFPGEDAVATLAKVVSSDSNAFIQIDPLEIDELAGEEDIDKNLIIEKTYYIPYGLPVSISDDSVTEGETLQFTVTLAEASDEPVSVDYSSEKGSGTVSFAPGETTQIIEIPTPDDQAKEETETFEITLNNPNGVSFPEALPNGESTITATGTIFDNDGKPEQPKGPRSNSHGEPHLINFDGLGFDFQAVGEFTLVKSASGDLNIQVRQQPVRPEVSVNKAVATVIDGTRIVLYTTEQGDPLKIDGIPTEIPDGNSITVGGGSIYLEGNEYTIVYPSGNQLIAQVYGNHINFDVYLSENRTDSVTGLLGNNNQNPNDDIALRDGTVLNQPVPFRQLYREFGESWRITQAESLFDYEPGEDTNTFIDRNFPTSIVTIDDLNPADRQRAEEIVDAAGITDPILRANAILDIALTGDTTFLEGALRAKTPESSLIIRVEPEATADFISTFANTPVHINPLSNDIVTTGIPLSLIGYDQTTAKGGTIQLDNNGTPDDQTDDQLIYTPAANFIGIDTINYTIADDQTTATGTISVIVPAINLTDTNGNNGFTVTGAAGNFAGSSVSNIGDFNGDSIDDFIVGGFAADPNNINATGESYVIFGTNQGFPANLDLSTLNGTNGFIIEGFEAESFSGGAVSSAGDLNGDGFKDVMIGAFASNSNSLNDSGRTYVIFGSNQPFSTRFNLANINGNNGFVINSNQPLDYAGLAVSSAGDFNNDGLDDLAVAAPAGVDTFLGKVYVVYGRQTPFPPAFNPTDLEDDKGTIINHNNGLAGTTVSNAGDLNGDGIDDLIIGGEQGLLEGNPKAGETYVLFGIDGGYPNGFSLSNLNGRNGFTIKGDGYSVSSVSGAGDLNADGLEDILIGVSQSPSNNQINAGKAYVLFGTEARFPKEFDLFTLNGNNGFVVNGVEADELLGGSVKAAGDVNGDQIDDIIIGASGATANGIQGAGKTYVVFGSNQGFPASLNSSDLNGENGFFLNGTAENELSGVAVSSAGDINQDSVNDILIGAPGSLFDNTEGKTYVVFGSSSFGNQPQV